MIPELERLFDLVGRAANSREFAYVVSLYRLAPDESTSAGIYWEAPTRGISILAVQARVESVFLHADGKDGFAEFAGALPLGLHFDMSFDEVRSLLGRATRSFQSPSVQELGAEARYGNIQLTFSPDGRSISLVTLDDGKVP